MNKEFIPYEQALELKELGFDEKCYGHYDSIGELNTVEDYARLGANISEMLSKEFNSVSYMKEMCSAPLYQQAFRWFREKYDLIGLIHIGSQEFSFSVYKNGHRITPLKEYLNYNGTYEEAENACMKKLIEIVKNKNHDTSTKKSR
jgi:hypothetical protein